MSISVLFAAFLPMLIVQVPLLSPSAIGWITHSACLCNRACSFRGIESDH